MSSTWSAAATTGRISRARRSSTLSLSRSPVPSNISDDQMRLRLCVISRLSKGLAVSKVS